MYYRRKILLNLIFAFGEQGIKKITLQKLIFLFCQQQAKPAFDFVPYKYGCFSFQATKDLNLLASHYQLIRQDSDKWFTNEDTDYPLSSTDQTSLSKLLIEFKCKNNKQTIDYVYHRYPYYSINSQWSMSANQKLAAKRERSTIEAKSSPCLFTIGYEGKSIDAYLNELIKNNIKLLCDVRKNPLSMKYGFSKSQLKKCCGNLSIAYEHIPGLGIESNKRQNLNTKEDYKRLFSEYKKTLPNRQQGLNRVLQLLENNNRIALTCFEHAHHECHRHCVSDYLQKTYTLECIHL